MASPKKKPPHPRRPGIIRSSRDNMPMLRGLQRPKVISSARRRYISTRRGSGITRQTRMRNWIKALPRMLANDTNAGKLLITAALIALIWANLPEQSWQDLYFAISNAKIGPESLHLHMSVAHWAQDGVLTLFFFVIGLELKTEFVTGSLRNPREAALPMIAAVFGMAGPALVYILVVTQSSPDAYHGWAIASATDIAFAVAILGIFGHGLPPAARTFLLTLAVVDDLLGIIIIAIFYSEALNYGMFAITLVIIGVFAVLVQKHITKWWLLIPLALLAWYFMHASGIHATIAGVALGMVIPAKRYGDSEQLTQKIAVKVNPWSAGLAVPVFAFFAAGVNITNTTGGIANMIFHPVAVAVMLALPFGKCLGIWGSVALLTKTTRLRLGHGVDLADIFPISVVAGIGFTVSLLIASLAFVNDPLLTGPAKIGVLLGTTISAILGAILLRLRLRTAARGRH